MIHNMYKLRTMLGPSIPNDKSQISTWVSIGRVDPSCVLVD